MSHESSGSEPKPQTAADRGQILLMVLIGLALVASVIMLFMDSDGAQKIALLAALWAAILAFFLLYRDRKQVEMAHREVEEKETIHRAELEKKQAEAQADKFRLEKQHQAELRVKDNETLKEIRQQLEEMRVQLSELSGREWVYEPAVVQAEARRIIELETEQNRLNREAERSTPEPVAPEHVETVPTPEWTAQDEPQDVVDVQVEQPTPEIPEPEEEPSRHAAPDVGGGRRRRDERRGGVSVAELLAAARKKDQK